MQTPIGLRQNSSNPIESDRVLKALRLQQEFFSSHKTRNYDFRIKNLEILKNSLVQNEGKILKALSLDLRKHEVEAYAAELGMVLAEIRETSRHLKKWMRPQRVPTPLLLWPARSAILREPLGQTLIISPWNYPLQLSLVPLVGSLAAGNVVVLKPSEEAPHTSAVLREILAQIFPEELCLVLEGGADLCSFLLEKPWGHIFFTGSTAVGQLVAQAAAKTLSPVTLELGGKSPCIVTESAKVEVAARRIVFGKFFNAGQTCVAPDYILVAKSRHEELLLQLKSEIKLRFGPDPLKNSQLPKIINGRHYERLKSLIKQENVYHGGRGDDQERILEPTLLTSVSMMDPVMKQEIFGPILPVIPFESFAQAATIIAQNPKPLALYIFSENQGEKRRWTESFAFGGGCINDTLMHLANPHLPFGGIGTSGIGAYHGKFSFECFSHKKALLKNPTWIDLPFRYFPWTKFKNKLFRRLLR